MNILTLPIWSLNGKSYAFMRYLDNTIAGLKALNRISHEPYEYTYSLN